MILKSSNENDLPKLLNYGKAKGILRLNKLMPTLTPFKEVILVDSFEDLLKIQKTLPENYFYRRDLPLNIELGKRTPKSGKKENMLEFFKKMKETEPKSALLILPSDIKNLPRYVSNGAFNVAINKGENVILEFVGKGFDARELTHGTVCHETYNIPWYAILFCNNVIKLNKYKVSSITEKEYQATREERIKYLNKIGATAEQIDEYLPKNYVAPKNSVKELILDKIVFPLFLESQTMKDNNLNFSWICGNITDKNIVMPYEYSTPERVIKNYTAKNVEQNLSY